MNDDGDFLNWNKIYMKKNEKKLNTVRKSEKEKREGNVTLDLNLNKSIKS